MATSKKNVAQTTTATGGINVNGISPIQRALNDYINAVIKKCDMGASTAQIQAAVKGSASEAAVKNMYNTIDKEMQAYVRMLSQYSTVLDNMKTAYTNNDGQTSSFAR